MSATRDTRQDPPPGDADPCDDQARDDQARDDDASADAWVADLLAAQPDEVMPDAVADRIVQALARAQAQRELSVLAPTADPSDLLALRGPGRRLPGQPGRSSSLSREALDLALPED